MILNSAFVCCFILDYPQFAPFGSFPPTLGYPLPGESNNPGLWIQSANNKCWPDCRPIAMSAKNCRPAIVNSEAWQSYTQNFSSWNNPSVTFLPTAQKWSNVVIILTITTTAIVLIIKITQSPSHINHRHLDIRNVGVRASGPLTFCTGRLSP